MTLTQLDYFIALAEHRNFSAAAKACGVSQPTLSAQFQKLEEEIGHSLVDRKTQPIQLTAMGQFLVDQARRTVSTATQIGQLVDQFEHPLTGQLRLGMVAPMSKKLGPSWISQCQMTFPGLDLQVLEANSAELQQMMQQAELDAAILPMDSWKGVGQSQMNFEESWWALGPISGLPLPELTDVEQWLLGSDHQDATRYAQRQGWKSQYPSFFQSESVASRVAIGQKIGKWVLLSESELEGFGLDAQKRALKWPGPLRSLTWISGPHAQNKELQTKLLRLLISEPSP
ncbi:MAG: LysR family transcriptional regulator [Schleiferiaceae bacterium]|nr:LysR family transcriptional regulator [Schleiferiaceae bacterium]